MDLNLVFIRVVPVVGTGVWPTKPPSLQGSIPKTSKRKIRSSWKELTGTGRGTDSRTVGRTVGRSDGRSDGRTDGRTDTPKKCALANLVLYPRTGPVRTLFSILWTPISVLRTVWLFVQNEKSSFRKKKFFALVCHIPKLPKHIFASVASLPISYQDTPDGIPTQQ